MIRRVGLSLFFPVLLGAQTGRGTITGRITDPAGAAVPGASVTCTSSATQASLVVRSNRAGEYNLAGVEPASYRITVSAERFRRMLRGPVSVAASATVRLDFQLQIGEASEVIEVSAPVAQVDANSAVVATAVRNRLVDQLPLVVGGTMRSPFDLVSIAAETRGSGTGLSLGGGQAAAWDATLDGLSMTTSRPANASDLAFIAPSVEAITEFVVETNGFKAEYGQAGGGPMTFVSKRISLKGELRLEFRCEAFNIFNRTVFGTGNSNLDSGDFGQITNQVNDPRQMQFAAKLYW